MIAPAPGDPGEQPVLAIDHVIVTASDPEAAAEDLWSRAGLAATPGGRHAGHGTGNLIVPLGDAYIELMYVVDHEEATASPLGRWVLERPTHGLAALCLRTDDIDTVAARIGRTPLAMSRRTPDGDELAWELVGLEDALDDGLPFFIQWAPGVTHPGTNEADHRSEPQGVVDIALGADPRLSTWLGDHDLPVRIVDEPPGPRRIEVATAAGPIVIGPDGLE